MKKFDMELFNANLKEYARRVRDTAQNWSQAKDIDDEQYFRYNVYPMYCEYYGNIEFFTIKIKLENMALEGDF